MSIKDSTGTARNFSLVSMTGLTTVHAGLDTTSKTEIIDKQTRTTKVGGYNSHLRSTRVDYLDEDGSPKHVRVNTTIEFPQETAAATAFMRDALLLNHRGLIATDDGTGVPASAESYLDSISRGIPPSV